MGLPNSLTYTQLPQAEAYSEVIDVRSPSEFAEDCIPGAINLPVLDDTERAKVGTIYKQVCPFTARKVGAALVAKNIAQHIESHFAAKDKDYHPLVYCWRGGQRSNSMALVLAQIGWRVTVLQGGYKTYRSYVRDQLEHQAHKFTYRVLCGLTGSGKTHILRQMTARGFQVMDLEGLANHRGSLLGEEWEHRSTVGAGNADSISGKQTTFPQNPPSSEQVVGAGLENNMSTTQTTFPQNPPSCEQVVGAGNADSISGKQTTFPQNPPSSEEQGSKGDGERIDPNSPPHSSCTPQQPRPSAQPSQKYFESLLLQQLERFDASKPVWLEAESNKIGRVYLPKSLWDKMKQASCVEIQVPLEARIEWLLQEYPHFKTHPEVLKAKLQHLKSRYGREKINEWYHLIDAGQWESLVGDLLLSHYDPTYTQSMSRCFSQVEKVMPLADLSDVSVNELLGILADHFQ